MIVFWPQLVGVVLLVFVAAVVVDGSSLQSDKDALIDLKRFLQQNNAAHWGKYEQWREGDASPCGWSGIVCTGSRVTGIDLSNSMPQTQGMLYPHFSSLTALASLDLSGNAFSGPIPADLGQCASLRYLNLSYNILESGLDVSRLVNLETLDVTVNRLNGTINATFPLNCSSLVAVNLSSNWFTGDINGCFDRCTRLQKLDLSSNFFSGPLWQGFARLKEFSVSENNHIYGVFSSQAFAGGCELVVLDLSENEIGGTIPAEIARCRGLAVLNLWGNKLSGKIPTEIGLLKELRVFNLGNNSFHPDIPVSLVNCSKLSFLDLSRNNFSGDVPKTIGEFRQIKTLALHGNSFTGGIVSSGLLKIPNLTRLDLSSNKFSGDLPVELTQVSSLKYLILSNNSFSGSIPPEFGNLTGLQALDISYNNLTGTIPPEIGKLTSLLWLMLAQNMLTGEIPREIGNCSSLLWLNLADNMLSGALPVELSMIGTNAEKTFAFNRQNLVDPIGSGECLVMKRWIPAMYQPFSFVYTLLTRKSCRGLWDSVLRGEPLFPICVRDGDKVKTELAVSGYLQLTGNNLSGQIPPSLSNMKRLSLINLGYNNLSGSLPPEIGRIPLKVLNLTYNSISGRIPDELGDLTCLEILDLSFNNFSGEFPSAALSRLHQLNKLNVSFNKLLTGTVTMAGQLLTFDNDSFIGDPLLCVLSRPDSAACHHTSQLPIAPQPLDRRRLPRPPRRTIISLVLPALSLGIILCAILVLIFCHVARPSDDAPVVEMALVGKKMADDSAGCSSSSQPSSSSDPVKVFRLDKTAFTYTDILFATEHFSERRVVGSGGFGKVYRGVLPDGREVAVKKLLREGAEAEKEFRAEMEVLSGGEMGWRHPNLVALYGWCLFGAEKLLVYEYIPGGSLEEAISVGRLGGWRRRVEMAEGVARALVYLHHECYPAVVHRDVKSSNVLLDAEGRARVTDFGLARVMGPGDSHVSTVIAGSVGYVAPEYGQTWRATTKGDVYSYGVLLMELVTGRKAIGGVEGDRTEGACLVEWVKGLEAGPAGLRKAVDTAIEWGDGYGRMARVLELALWCTAEIPQRRPDMKEVLATLVEIRGGSRSPTSPSR
ncbi:probable LRR receptor-like serine/threonine-protein kinase At1g74360 [Nymphaea colorata]|nr:probable LRR receptor-like serine/threonine-protein kinase At1g74360 [Nymphaea colorata]